MLSPAWLFGQLVCLSFSFFLIASNQEVMLFDMLTFPLSVFL